MAIIDTALVSNGNLLIQLDDGTVVNAGRVAGPQGPAGRDGQDGSPGIPGAKGDAGENGAKWHTGVGAPEVGLGENGDLYMDVASALLPIYQKVNRDWLFLCNLKVPPSGGGGGQGGAAGGGGSVILYPMPDGGTPPDKDNDGKPIDKGDIWLDLNTGWLWVYDGNNWVPVADRPPVIISPTPPEHNNASNEDPNKPPQYTVKDGDLWLDPSTNQLYIYRDGAWSEITACTTAGSDTGAIDFPVGTDFPANGDQIPNGHQHDNFYWDATLGAWKRVCGVSTEHCVRHYRSSCNGGSNAWTGTASYSSVYEIQTEGDEQDLNVKDVFEVKYTGQTDYINVLDLDATEQARIGFDRVENGTYYFTNTAEVGIKDSIAVRHVVTLEDEDGNIYECPTTIYRLVFTSGTPPHNGNGVFGHADVLCCFDFEAEDKRYLLAYGDNVDDATDPAVYEWNKPVTLSHAPAAYSKSSVGISNQKITVESDKDMDVFAPNGEMKISMDTGTLGIGGYPEMEFDYDGVKLVNDITESTDSKHIVDKKYSDAQDELLRQDIIELEEEINAIAPSLEYGTWKYEEPTGGNVTRPPATGTFYLMNGAALTDEYLETTIIKIHNDEFVAPGDTDPVDNHTWADADVGELIQLFDAADPDFFLGKITAKNVDAIGEFVALTVDRVQSSGVPNDNADPVTGEFLTRVNIFKEPSGGTASEFVLKSGDEMSGNLTMGDNFASGADVDSPEIKFVNQDNYDTEYTCKLSTAAGSTRLNLEGGGGFAVHGSVYSSQHYQYWDRSNNQGNVRLGMDGTGGFLANHGGGSNVNDSNKQLTWTAGGNLMYNGDSRLVWKSDGGELRKGTSTVLEWDSGSVSIRKTLKFNTSDSRLYARTSSSTTSIGAGTAGQVLASNGSSNPPYWTNQTGVPSGGSKGQVLKKSHSSNTVGWEGAVHISTDGSNRAKGEMWYNSNDGTLYLKVS